MSMPMICSAAARASSGVCASLMPPALPRPPTGTWALTATGPSSPHARAASSAVRATLPGGIGIPSEARTSFAWYSRSFTGEKGSESARPGAGTGQAAESGSERNVPVPAWRPLPLLAAGDPQRPDQRRAGVAGLDHVVQVSALGSHVGIGEPLAVVGHQLATLGGPVLRPVDLSPEDDVDRPPRAPHG